MLNKGYNREAGISGLLLTGFQLLKEDAIASAKLKFSDEEYEEFISSVEEQDAQLRLKLEH
jgi:hypothetical protein